MYGRHSESTDSNINFDCYAAAIAAAIPDAIRDPDDLYDRVAYLNNIATPDGFSIYANEKELQYMKGMIHKMEFNDGILKRKLIIFHMEFNALYKIIHRV